MSGKHALTQGSCLCGTVRYEVAGSFDMMVHCHCSMCRKHHGGSFATFVSAPLMGFRWTGGTDSIIDYTSSGKAHRSFCRSCSSVLPMVMKEMDIVVCPAGNLQGDLNVRPQAHWFVTSKAPWYTITDSLPEHEEYPEEFGATGVTRPQIDVPPGIIAGSCLCADVAYEISGSAIRMVHCHCSRCRRARSSAHATNVIYKIDGFRFTRGESAIGTYKVPEAQHFSVAFCRRCGSAAPRVSAERGIVIVPAGSLDSDPGVQPQAHIFVQSKASWFPITDGLPQFDEMIR